ncbi:MAG: DNA repair protein RecN [Acidimicrobiales bacterium]
MLVELRVRDLGVIDDLTLFLGPGMTALTGETGTGKTLVVEAIELLLGGRADPVLVRPGALESVVEGRFARLGTDEETVLARTVAAAGRGRSYVDGRMATTAVLGEAGRALLDLHGQHAHQSLLSPSAQRDALDGAAGIDIVELAGARQRLRDVEAAMSAVGGDQRTRARELDLLRFQLGELDAAGLDDPDEEDALRAEEVTLAGASALRQAASAAHAILSDDDGAIDRIGAAMVALHGPPGAETTPLGPLAERLRGLEAEVADVASEALGLIDGFEDNPQRLAEVSARRARLGELRRKYGDTLAEVIAFQESARRRLTDLVAHDARVAALETERGAARAAQAGAEARLAAARSAAAEPFAGAVEAQLHVLAMARARFAVDVGAGPGGEPVTWLLGANPGEPLLPLRKVASGGELARTMLATRLVLAGAGGLGLEGPRTLIFDEVDAGIGGEAALAVGRSLASLGRHHQVLVVTHLPQVAAFADAQVAIRKEVVGGRTRARAEALEGSERVVELSRMLSGQPGSATARRHAEELLASARRGD